MSAAKKDEAVRHYYGFQVPAHLCTECGTPVECGYAADHCPGDNFICTPCADQKARGDSGCRVCGSDGHCSVLDPGHGPDRQDA